MTQLPIKKEDFEGIVWTSFENCPKPSQVYLGDREPIRVLESEAANDMAVSLLSVAKDVAVLFNRDEWPYRMAQYTLDAIFKMRAGIRGSASSRLFLEGMPISYDTDENRVARMVFAGKDYLVSRSYIAVTGERIFTTYTIYPELIQAFMVIPEERVGGVLVKK